VDDRSTLLWLEARIKVVEETIRNSTIGREPPLRRVAVLCPKNGDTEICTLLGGVLIILSTVTLATIAFWPHLEDVFFSSFGSLELTAVTAVTALKVWWARQKCLSIYQRMKLDTMESL